MPAFCVLRPFYIGGMILNTKANIDFLLFSYIYFYLPWSNSVTLKAASKAPKSKDESPVFLLLW